MAAGPIVTRNQAATVYVGGFDEKVTEEVLWELFLQAGRVVNIHLPKDRISQAHQGYGFVELFDEDDADYTVKIMNMIKLYGKPIRVNKASAHQKTMDIGANIFIGNLDPEVDEKLIYDTFSAFGVLLQVPKIVRDPLTGNSRGFCFLHYASFEASDAAVAAMHNQHLCNRVVSVSYAYRKDVGSESDRRHGSAAERLLAANNPVVKNSRPNQLFADAPPLPVAPPPPLPPTLSETIAPPISLSDATGGFNCPPLQLLAPAPPPPLQELATPLPINAQPDLHLAAAAACPPPPPPPAFPPRMTSLNEHSLMEGADPPPLGRLPPPPSNISLQQGLQSFLPPPPPPPSTISMPPPPPHHLSPSWNNFQRFQPPARQEMAAPHPNRFAQLTPQHLVSSPFPSSVAPQHTMNIPPCPGPAGRNTGFNQTPFMQGNQPRPPYWNNSRLYQDSRRR